MSFTFILFTLYHLFFKFFTFMSINLCTLNLFHLNCFYFFFLLRIQTQRPILLNEIEKKLHNIMQNKGSYIFRNRFLFYSCVFLYTWHGYMLCVNVFTFFCTDILNLMDLKENQPHTLVNLQGGLFKGV